jgi:hypothetical protein
MAEVSARSTTVPHELLQFFQLGKTPREGEAYLPLEQRLDEPSHHLPRLHMVIWSVQISAEKPVAPHFLFA